MTTLFFIVAMQLGQFIPITFTVDPEFNFQIGEQRVTHIEVDFILTPRYVHGTGALIGPGDYVIPISGPCKFTEGSQTAFCDMRFGNHIVQISFNTVGRARGAICTTGSNAECLFSFDLEYEYE